MKQIWITLCLVLCLAASCSRPLQTTEPLRSIVSCDFLQVEDTVFYPVRLYYNTPFTACQEIHPVAWPQLSFNVSCTLFTPQQMMLAVDEQHTLSFLVWPGDSVHLDVDCAALQAGRYEDAVSFSGGHARLNAEIQPWTAHIYPQLYRTWDEFLSGEAFVEQFTSALESLGDSLDAYAAANGMSAEAREWAARDLKFCLSNTLPSAPRGQQSNFFARDFFDMADPANFSSMMFMPHLRSYVGSVMTEARKHVGMQAPPADLAREMVRMMALLPAGMVRDAVFCTFVSDIISGGNRDALYEAVPDLEDYIGLPEVKTLLAGTYLQYVYSISDDVFVDSALHLKDGQVEQVQPDTLFAAWLSRRHPGRIVCMELGTAWCEACAYEQEHIPALRKALGADSSRVVFVNCCVDSEIDAWQVSAAAGSPDAEHFYLSPDTEHAMSDKYHIETFPAFFLIDADGNIRPEQAPYPSHFEDALAAIRALL